MTGPSGVGIGWRPEIAGFVAELPGLRFVEVVAEGVSASGPLPPGLTQLRDRAVTVVPHGVRLSSAAPSRSTGPGSRTWPLWHNA